MTGTVARRVVVSGDVQGVFFRDGMRREAAMRDVRGWVRNGATERCRRTSKASRMRSPRSCCGRAEVLRHATVEDLVVTTVEVAGLEGFRIR